MDGRSPGAASTPPHAEVGGHRPGLRAPWRWLGVLVLLPVVLTWLAFKPGLAQLDLLVYDRMLPLASQPPAEDILIVAIDESSLASLGRWPWPRSVHARLLSELTDAGVASVLLDMFLTEPSKDPREDADLARAMGRLPVFLPMMAEREIHSSPMSAPGFVRPMPLFEAQARGIGHGELLLDADGIARGLYMRIGPAGSPQPYVGLLVAGGGEDGREEGIVDPAGWRYAGHLRLSYAGPAGSYRRASYVDVLGGLVPREWLRGKTVLVGATAPGLGDQVVAPAAARAGLLPGVEVHANAIDQLMHRRSIRELSPVAMAIWIASVLGIAAALLRWRPAAGLPLVAAVAAGCLATSAAALGGWRWWLPVATPAVGLALVYALWSWLGLREKLHFLAAKANELQAVPAGIFEVVQSAAHTESGTTPREALDRAIQRTLRLQALTESSLQALPHGVLLCDPRGAIVGGNTAVLRSLGRSGAADLTGAQALRGVPLADLLASCGRQPRAGGAPASADTRLPGWLVPLVGEYLTEQGRYLQLLAAPVASLPDEAPPGYIVVLADLTAEREAQRQREKWNRFLSHDLRSPQVTILGLLELDGGRSVSRELSQSIRREAERTLSFAEEFLDVSHAWSGAYRLALTHVPTVVLDAFDQVWASSRRGQVEVELRIDDAAEEAEAMLDGALVARALVNLLLNAIGHSHPGSAVYLCLAADAQEVVVSVRDEGPGMDSGKLEQMLAGAGEALPGRAHRDGVTRSHGLGFEFARTVFGRHGARFEGWTSPGQGCTLSVAFARAM
ncbi:MAG: histidine kinase [Variovorax paradoxus]|uniref:histidine kinase n=1 Tax=Variovorax paradoxus TaxID=34073 RepID=A0A2W5S6F0_VARPD|nr:MAG: histidine kinase [Variovorax paradoxus]